MRYLSQRYTMPDKTVGGLLTDIGTEELAAEQKARTVYDNLLRVINDPEVWEPLKF